MLPKNYAIRTYRIENRAGADFGQVKINNQFIPLRIVENTLLTTGWVVQTYPYYLLKPEHVGLSPAHRYTYTAPQHAAGFAVAAYNNFIAMSSEIDYTALEFSGGCYVVTKPDFSSVAVSNQSHYLVVLEKIA